MRMLELSNTGIFTAVAGLAALVLLFMCLPQRPQMWVYPLVRQVTAAKVNYESRNMLVDETPHFIIKYSKGDANTIGMIAQAAEAAYGPVTAQLGYAPRGKTLLLVQPDKRHLQKAFGWSGSETAMGVYWGGVIQLLSPNVWMHHDLSTADFIHSGPMVHEFTHLVFDDITNGNYPRWFTEGMAQYMEYKINDYEWKTPTNSLQGKLYTMAQLDNHFDALSNQSLAYRESLAAVRYIAQVHGQEKLREVITGLKRGKTMPEAIQTALGMNYNTFAKCWQNWAVVNMK
jgi:hypothetical protein